MGWCDVQEIYLNICGSFCDEVKESVMNRCVELRRLVYVFWV